MSRPLVLLAEPMYHAAGEELLRAHCEVRVLHSPDAASIAAAAAGAHALIARYPHRVDDALFDAAPGLVIVACSGRGTDAIDIPAATRHGVAVVNNPGFGMRPVSEAAIALMLTLARRVFPMDAWMRRGEGWQHRSNFADFMELEGKTLGIVGLGQIGTETARKAIAAFHMQVLAYDPYVPASKAEALGARLVASLDELLAASDIVSMHPELNPGSLGMIGEAQMRRMKRTAYLVNTSRGKVVRQAALVKALSEGWIAGAALDVYEDEPLGPDNPLYELKNVVLMPHVAGLTIEAVEGMSRSAAGQVLQALAGKRPAHILNPESWPQASARAQAAALTLNLRRSTE
ncbi:MAG: hydroxyacid dehydrogenase [Betaproteobacteria bacterium]|nr:hydroxyacid dehydrogenase [Betaproteobacteria bacterium]